MRRAVDEPDAFYAADVDFHIAVFGASGNTLIERLSTILRPLLRSSFRLQGEAGGSLRHWVPLHEAVYDAIVARDPAAAGTAMDGVLALASSDLTKATLNRVEAACLPHNAPSIALLEKVGFTREGYARKYLCIDGRWQDHLLYGIVRDDPRR